MVSVAITGNQNNWQPFKDYVECWRVSSDQTRSITGIADGADGLPRTIINVGTGSQDLTIANQNASSSAFNRIITGTGADMTVTPDNGVFMRYDSTTSRWRVLP